jgi:Putative papain-like cysteine peptidase (DUF1796)
MITHCIEDDFSIYLDKEYHQAVPEEMRIHKHANVCEHTYYRDNFGVRFVFNHYDPTVDEYYQYYERCVARFRHVMNSQAQNLLVCIADHISHAEFLRLNEALQRYPSSALLVVRAIPSGWKEFGAALIDTRSENHLYELKITGQIGAMEFSNGYDEAMLRALLDAFE